MGSTSPSPVPPAGVWCPAITFFDPTTGHLDLAAQKQWYAALSKSGLTGLVVLGTNSETFLLTREERATLLRTAREAVGPDFPIMAGVSGFSNIQVLEFLADAKDARANSALLLPPTYFAKATTPAIIEGFYNDVAQKSPLPIVIYNFPVVCNGIDLDSEVISRLATNNPGKIVGVKLTCGSVAKITRLAAAHPPESFATFGGQADFLVGGLAVGSAGCISAFANVFPKTIVHIYRLWKDGKTEEALKLHQVAAVAETPCKAGIAAIKYAASVYNPAASGIEGAEEKLKPRLPYQPLGADARDKLRGFMEGMVASEKTL